MTEKGIYQSLKKAKTKGEKKFIVLIDPDQVRLGNIDRILQAAAEAKIDMFFVGGSIIMDNALELCLHQIKQQTNIPAILFPGNSFQINNHADGILFLSLISGRNPELLIGKHVITAPYLKESNLEIISTGYILIDGGAPSAVSYMSNTTPIPADKADIAACTAMAGEMLGLKLVYLDAGSGAQMPVSEKMIKAVSSAISIPLIVGGGVKTPEKAIADLKAGADILVVGNAIEKNPALIKEISEAVHSFNKNYSEQF